jgi:hypothetical protein
MSDLQFTDWTCSNLNRHWIKRMISANGTIEMFTWVSLFRDNLVCHNADYESMTDDEILNEQNQVWVVLFGDKLARFQVLYDEMYGNRHKVTDVKFEEILSNIDLFLERIVILNIFM